LPNLPGLLVPTLLRSSAQRLLLVLLLASIITTFTLSCPKP
jgi:hypothetical protein